MKYVSIDIETTGLNPEEHQIIEFAAIIEDSKNPKSYEESKKFRRVVLSPDRMYNFSSYAAKINSNLIKIIAAIENNEVYGFGGNDNLSSTWVPRHELIGAFKQWLLCNEFKENSRGVLEIIVAGKNFASFDKQFILALPDFESYGIRFHHRSLDPCGAYINWNDDEVPPSTETCKLRANLNGEVKHEALADAWDVIQLLRPQYSQTLDLRPVMISKKDVSDFINQQH